MKFVVTLIILVLLFMFAGCNQWHCEQVPIKPKVTILAFGASWCSSCKQQAASLAEIEANGIAVERINIDERQDLAEQYGVGVVPTYIFFRDGKEVGRTHDLYCHF